MVGTLHEDLNLLGSLLEPPYSWNVCVYVYIYIYICICECNHLRCRCPEMDL